MLIQNLIPSLKRPPQQDHFYQDVVSWFHKEEDGHMGKWLYSESAYKGDPVRGAQLWQHWEKTDSYYTPESQSTLIRDYAGDITKLTGPADLLLDWGPGESDAVISNTLPFIDAYDDNIRHYVPVDICESYIDSAVSVVRKHNSAIICLPQHKDFLKPGVNYPSGKKVTGICFGSTVGNYASPQKSKYSVKLLIRELKLLKRNLPEKAHLIVGLDANQDMESLYQSYDHPVHAAFVTNILFRIKRDLLPYEQGFQPENWRYRMAWYPESHQFCHIAECTQDQNFTLDGEYFRFEKGDQLVADNSFKFPVGIFQQASIAAGFEPKASFLDKEKRMALHVIST